MVSKIKRTTTIMEGLTILVVVVASLKFLFQGGPITVFGAADASTYAMFLAPVLGTHGYLRTKGVIAKRKGVDNLDGN